MLNCMVINLFKGILCAISDDFLDVAIEEAINYKDSNWFIVLLTEKQKRIYNEIQQEA